MQALAFVRHWHRNYVYQRQQLGAAPLVAGRDALLDVAWLWQSRRRHGL